MTQQDYALILCAGQRRHPTRLLLSELQDWLQADAYGAQVRLVDYQFHWLGGFPTLHARLRAEQGSKAFEHGLIAWSETALDSVLFRHPWDETPLIAERLEREGFLNVLRVSVRPLAVTDSTDFGLPPAWTEAVTAAVLAADLRDFAGIKRGLPVLLREFFRHGELPASSHQEPGPLFEAKEREALHAQKQRLVAAGRLDHAFAGLDPELRQRLVPVKQLIEQPLKNLSPRERADCLAALLNRFGLSPREADYLLFLAAPAAGAERPSRRGFIELTPAVAGF